MSDIRMLMSGIITVTGNERNYIGRNEGFVLLFTHSKIFYLRLFGVG